MNTTIKVSKEAQIKWKKWCKAKGMSSVEFMDELIKVVGLKHQQAFYNSLPDPKKIKYKPLSTVHLCKKYTLSSGI